MHLSWIVLSATIVLGITFCAYPAQQRPGIVGKEAPAWGVTEWINLSDGQTSLDVTDLRGKVIYLYCFQSWCPGCHSRGFPTLQKIAERYKGNDDVAVVAVQTVFEGFSTNTARRAWETAKKYNLSIPVGHDGTAGVRSVLMGRYRTGGTPWTVIIDRDGVVRFNDFHITPERAIRVMERLRTQPLSPGTATTANDEKPRPAVHPLPADRGMAHVIGRRVRKLDFDGVLDAQGDAPAARATMMRWWTDGCPHCEASLPGIEALRTQYADKGLSVLAVYHPKPPGAVDPRHARRAADRLGYRGAIALDQDWSELQRVLGNLEKLRATSVTILLDEHGVIRWAHPGPVLFPSESPEHALENADYRLLRRAIDEILGLSAGSRESVD